MATARPTPRRGSTIDRVCMVLVPLRSRLRRSSDRWETASAWAALVLLVLLMPVMLVVGGAQTQAARDQAAAVRATSHQVTAIVIAVSTGPETAADGTPSDDLIVTVSWIEPDGPAHTAPQDSYGKAPRVGDTWPLWVNRDLSPVQPPSTEPDAELEGLLTAIVAFLGMCVVLASALALVRWLLDRDRLRQWDEDWLAFERRRNRGPTG
jgi:hypothetical protein